MTLSTDKCQFLYKKKIGRTLLYEVSPKGKSFIWCEWWVRLRTLAERDAVSKTKRRGRQVRYGNIETSGTARVKNRRFKSILYKNKKDLPKGKSFIWCEWWDLNPYVGWHTPLKRACLPIPAHSQILTALHSAILLYQSHCHLSTKNFINFKNIICVEFFANIWYNNFV